MALTTNLGLTKISTGQESKETVINEFMDGIDAVVAGTNTKNLGGATTAQTLTAAEARKVVHVFSNAGSAIDVKYPLTTTARLIVVKNSAGFTLTIKTTAGGSAGVAIPNGKVRALFINGNDVEAAGPEADIATGVLTTLRVGGAGSALKTVHIGTGTDTPVTTIDGAYVTNTGDTAFILRDSANDIEYQLAIANGVLAGVLLGTVTNHPVVLRTNGTERARMPANGGFVIGTAALATTATDGFLYIPSCAGTPTGTPTSFTGRVPVIFDTTNNIFYIYDGGWIAGGGGGGGDMVLASVQTVTGAKTFDPAKLIVGEQSAPPSVVARALWVDSDDGKLYFGKRDGSAWAEVFISGVTGAISVPNGGTGATTLTGILKGNGTSAFTAATAGTDYVVPTATINNQTGTTYTLQASDNGKVVVLSNASAITVTLPSGLGVGFNCMFIQEGIGQVSFTTSGSTLRQRQSHTKIAGRYGTASVVCHVSNEFVLGGDTAA